MRAFETAIALAPRQIGAYRKLVTARKCAAADPFLAALENFVRDAAELPMAEQIELHFALGKALADVGQHERAFRHLLEGNRLKRQNTVYDEPKALELLERVSATFTTEMLREKAALGNPSPAPIFILGLPRSGSTLVDHQCFGRVVARYAFARDRVFDKFLSIPYSAAHI